MYMKKICVVGLGYIGLPTAAILAFHGQQVTGVDIDEDLLRELNERKIFIEEMEIKDVIRGVLEEGTLQVSSIPEKSDVFIIAVSTPSKQDKSCDLSCVLQAVKNILPFLAKENIIIIESTVPPQTCDNIVKPLVEAEGFRVGKDIFLAHCPERVIPGNIMKEIVENNRIVGGCSEQCSWAAADIYRTFVTGEIVMTDAKTAEMTKLVENTFRDVNIALANEMMKICNRLNINALDVIRLANKHPRVNIHQPGPGVGGHCLAVDPYFIIEKAPDLANIIAQAREINCSMPDYIVTRVKELIKEVEEAKIAVFGITYKGNVGDLRESPAIEIIDLLIKEKFEVSIYDPYANLENMENDMDIAISGADMILILSDHDEFRGLDYKKIAKNMRTPIIFDTKDVIDIKEYENSETNLYNLGNIFKSEGGL